MSKTVQPMSVAALEKTLPASIQSASKGQWRVALLKAGDLLNEHGMEYEARKTDNFLVKAAILFWQQLFKTGDLAFFKELGDRFDGKAPQAVALTDGDGQPVRFEKVVRQIVDVPAVKDPLAIEHKTVQ